MTSVALSPVKVEFEPSEAVSRLGAILLSTDLTSERDARRVIPEGSAALHVTRVAHENPTTPETLRRMGPRLAAAADLLSHVPRLAAVWYSCTAASVEIGDAAVAAAINGALPGVPVVTPPLAAIEGFAAMGVRQIALVTPYLVETTEPMVDYFARHGLEVVAAQCLGIADDRDMARVTARTIVDAVDAADVDETEGVFISCTALPAFGVVGEIEARLAKPVVSSNQASLWRLLHHAGLQPRSGAPGRLFRVAPLDRAA